MKKILLNLILIFGSIIVCLYLLELFLIVSSIDRDKIKRQLIKYIKQSNDFDTRGSYEFYENYKKKNPKAVMSISPAINPEFKISENRKIFVLSNVSNRENILCNENGYFAIYLSDRYGFNNPDSEWEKKNINYLLIGDSHTHGYCVNENQNIAGNLRKITNGTTSLLNLGQGGNGPLKNYATLREYIGLINVKKILWIHSEGNDISDLYNELQNLILYQYFIDPEFNQELSLIQDKIDEQLLIKLNQEKIKYLIFLKQLEKEKKYIKYLKLHRLVRFKNKAFRELKKYNDSTINDQFINLKFKKIINLTKKIAKENRAEFYFIYLPSYHGYKEKIVNIGNENYEKIINLINDLNIPIIDLRKKILEDHYDPLSLIPFRTKGHFNETGYSLIASMIYEELKKVD